MTDPESIGSTEGNVEKKSGKTVKFWLPESREGRGEYIGEIFIENNQFVAHGQTDEDTDWLNKKLADIWIPQRGIPIFKKEGSGFQQDSEGRYVADGYQNHGNCTPDELLESLYDYTRSMGVFKVSFEERNT